jgi:hypothetical protein
VADVLVLDSRCEPLDVARLARAVRFVPFVGGKRHGARRAARCPSLCSASIRKTGAVAWAA